MHGPVVNGQASICSWNLEFSFLDKEQCGAFIAAFMKADLRCTIKYEVISDGVVDQHHVTIEDGAWAFNLSTVARLLEEIDFKDENVNI